MNEIERIAARHDRYEAALYILAARIPSTKGMNPKDRAARLHSVLEQRIAIATEALHPKQAPHQGAT